MKRRNMIQAMVAGAGAAGLTSVTAVAAKAGSATKPEFNNGDFYKDGKFDVEKAKDAIIALCNHHGYPIFDGFNVNRAIKNARIGLQSSELQVKDVDLGVQNAVFQLWVDYLTNLKVVAIELVNQDVARENVNIAFEKYKLGTINDIELRETQKKYIDAQYELLLSQFQAKQAEVELLKVSGGLGLLLK